MKKEGQNRSRVEVAAIRVSLGKASTRIRFFYTGGLMATDPHMTRHSAPDRKPSAAHRTLIPMGKSADLPIWLALWLSVLCGLTVGVRAGVADEAEVSTGQAIEIPEVIPGDAESYQAAGWAAKNAGEIELAREHYREALRLRPEFSEVEYNLAWIELEQREFDTAIARFESIAERPEEIAGWAHMSLATAMSGQGRPVEEVREQYRQAMEKLPTEPVAWFNFGAALYAENRFEEAVPVLEQAAILQPDSELIWLQLGRALKSMGRIPDAATCFARSFELDPENARAAAGLARTAVAMGEREKALKFYGKARELAWRKGNKWLILMIQEETSQL